jgi:NAD(P)-dependent dehydrogenase (short-subunit alcohol dehydrogenase family)
MSEAVLITGASSGIGRETALHLARRDYQVFAGVRRLHSMDDLQREGIYPVKLDVRREEEIHSIRNDLEEVFSRKPPLAFHLILNAGVGLGFPAELQPLEVLREVMEVNFFGSVRVVHAFLPLVKRYGGKIVFITSINGKIALPMMSAYASSKFATEGYADALRRELSLFAPKKVRVVIVEPGTIRTPIFDRSSRWSLELFASLPDSLRESYAHIPSLMEKAVALSLRQASPPEKVARAIERILRSRSPAPRYRVGLDADLQFWMSRLLPDRVVDLLIRLGYRLLERAVGRGGKVTGIPDPKLPERSGVGGS